MLQQLFPLELLRCLVERLEECGPLLRALVLEIEPLDMDSKQLSVLLAKHVSHAVLSRPRVWRGPRRCDFSAQKDQAMGLHQVSIMCQDQIRGGKLLAELVFLEGSEEDG